MQTNVYKYLLLLLRYSCPQFLFLQILQRLTESLKFNIKQDNFWQKSDFVNVMFAQETHFVCCTLQDL